MQTRSGWNRSMSKPCSASGSWSSMSIDRKSIWLAPSRVRRSVNVIVGTGRTSSGVPNWRTNSGLEEATKRLDFST